MYTLQASGPGVAVPFGGAADISNNEPQSTLSGQFFAEQLNSQFVSEFEEFSDFSGPPTRQAAAQRAT